jgi:cyclase
LPPAVRELNHFYDAVEAGATILLAASVFHFHLIDIPVLKSTCVAVV